jgi:hypothetical protein
VTRGATRGPLFRAEPRVGVAMTGLALNCPDADAVLAREPGTGGVSVPVLDPRWIVYRNRSSVQVVAVSLTFRFNV